MDNKKLLQFIRDYYDKRGLVMPNEFEASAFLTTEHAEMLELLFQRQNKFIRNNPHDKPVYSDERMAEEIGDVIMMSLVIAILVGVDPIEALVNKLQRKLDNLPKM
jgi:NTP pyrophosphatase (non-canonical NTP hydrolase)